jgi:hypothetical protein
MICAIIDKPKAIMVIIGPVPMVIWPKPTCHGHQPHFVPSAAIANQRTAKMAAAKAKAETFMRQPADCGVVSDVMSALPICLAVS